MRFLYLLLAAAALAQDAAEPAEPADLAAAHSEPAAPAEAAEPVAPPEKAPEPDAPPKSSNAVVGAAVGAFALAALAMASGGSKKKKPAALLLGPCGAGKTTLYHRLVDGEAVDAVMSMQAAEGMAGDQRVVDFPGHHRLRGPLGAELKRATSIVFVFDASNAAATAKAAAEVLYAVLTGGREVPVLVLCNKSDVPGAKTPARVKLILAAELETLRKTAGAIGAIDGDDAPRATLETGGRHFNFDTHSPCPISFLAFSQAADLAPLQLRHAL
eukprot:CAMPEP_0119270024 /NCGR_PEP_ID=MMETSP1329-20130426/7187_1 /TAXON_ID=114041 /ORGANISM="Genus nov. species nov., Strain RCC1024" /LENGTH=271 /DNA_ID=CAMNT_0007270029 /DNA_START=79 /DNA_END=890 /DNA_ORIENTATION=-